MRTIIAAGILAIVCPSKVVVAPRDPTPPNITVLVADDLGWRDIGVYGNRSVQTPHIDGLARAGLRVQWAFGTSPRCSPSRISMLSGKFPLATLTEDLHTPLPDSERILPYLQDAGY